MKVNNLLAEKTRIVRTSWGKTLTIKGPVHGFVVANATSVFLIWNAGSSPAEMRLYTKLMAGAESDLTFSFNINTNTVTVTLGWDTGAISYIGL